MNIFGRIKTDRLNFLCMQFEGAFNLLGVSLIGATTITPLFLQAYGANMKLVGFVSSLITSLPMIVSLFVGNLVSGVPSKKKVIIRVNSFTRTSILLMVPVLALHASPAVTLGIFILCISILFSGQSVSGLAWTDLMARCISPEQRGRFFGTLQVMAGIASVAAGYFTKLVLDSRALETGQKYSVIFGMAGVFFVVTVSVMFPLREPAEGGPRSRAESLAGYLRGLSECMKNGRFRLMTFTMMGSTAAAAGLSFVFLFAKQTLQLPPDRISNMIVIQTVGSITGGALWGAVCTKLGSRNVIRASEISALLIPLISLFALLLRNPSAAMYAAAFLIGLKTGGFLGYTNYLIEVIDEKLRVYGIVARSTLIFPFSFIGLAAGILADKYGMTPLFLIQAAVSVIAIVLSFGLKAIKPVLLETGLKG